MRTFPAQIAYLAHCYRKRLLTRLVSSGLVLFAIYSRLDLLGDSTVPPVWNNSPTRSAVLQIEQPRTEGLVASDLGSIQQNETPAGPALRIVQYEALIWVARPPKKIVRKSKAVKLDPNAYGPADFTSSIKWADFLSQLAGIVDSLQHLLTLSTLEWRWQKPANSIWVPLRDENGYASLLRKLREVKASRYLIFRMDAPAIPIPAAQSIPAQVSPIFYDVLIFYIGFCCYSHGP